MTTAITPNNPLFDFIEDVKDGLRAHWGKVASVTSTFGNHSIEYQTEAGEEYAIVAFMLPDDVFAEIEDGTYGTLNGFRIYREDLEKEDEQTTLV